jgi:hypothetical protein
VACPSIVTDAPSNRRVRPASPPGRDGCAGTLRVTARILFAGLSLAVVLTAFAAGRASASRGAPLVIPAAVVVIPVTAGDGEPDLEGFRRPPSTLPASSPAVASTPRPGPRPANRSITGIASWGTGWVGVVTRLPRGTWIRVCGALGCWSGRSVGYGPARWTGRIADLSRAVFADICGLPSMGLCRVVLSW